ncbi:MAG: Stk1 family PASTA domain-containing Ser/Thr kinase [Clostridia bacterium]|nr:Stk1 family PASTA domain-containing Ser/Thr kinase [Clostridia bacterium]
MENYLNKVLDNRYEIDEVIGTGGMAVVYRAKDRKLNRLVAVKVLKDELRTDEDLRRRFHAESEAMARLNHNNIIKVFDVSSTSENEYFVMEIVDGITLKQYINQREVLSIKESLHFTLQILKALEHAHHKKIVHRDIKPQNIMILRDGTVKVMDFGIARVMEAKDITQTKGAAFGTVHYIAPEQARGENIDGRADIYSVGVMLYEMLTGKLPFTGDSPLAVAMQHINSVPEPPGKINPNIPESLEIITLKAMCGDLNTRYHNAGEMIDEIEGFKKDPEHFVPKGNYVHGSEGDTIKFEPYSVAAASTSQEKNHGRKEKPEKVHGEKKKVSFFPIVATMAALMILAGVAITLWITILSPEAGSDDIPVPQFVGRTYESIINDETLNFEFVIKEEVYNAAYDAGVVVKQDKTVGSTAKEGSKIELTLSLGPRTAVMPDYHDWEYTKASNDLKTLMDKSVTVQFEFISSPSVEKYHIISTSPIAGDTIIEGSTVIFQISSGNDLETVEVPPLEGKKLDDARNMLYAAGLNIGDIKETVSDEYDVGTVIKQNTPANNFVPKGTAVDLEVCVEAPAAETTAPNNSGWQNNQWTYDPDVTTTALLTVELPTASYYPDRFYFEVYADGVRVFAETMEKGEDAVTLEIAGYGVKKIEIYVDSVLWKSEYLKVS